MEGIAGRAAGFGHGADIGNGFKERKRGGNVTVIDFCDNPKPPAEPWLSPSQLTQTAYLLCVREEPKKTGVTERCKFGTPSFAHHRRRPIGLFSEALRSSLVPG